MSGRVFLGLRGRSHIPCFKSCSSSIMDPLGCKIWFETASPPPTKQKAKILGRIKHTPPPPIQQPFFFFPTTLKFILKQELMVSNGLLAGGEKQQHFRWRSFAFKFYVIMNTFFQSLGSKINGTEPRNNKSPLSCYNEHIFPVPWRFVIPLYMLYLTSAS